MNKAFVKLVDRLKKDLKNQDVYIEKCKEYQEDIDYVDDIEIYFAPLDVSAKTVNGTIILNENLIESDDWEDIQRYTIHELTHCFQQENGLVDGPIKGRYLDDENEQEAFKAQLEYMSEYDSPEEIQEYLEQLLDHHNINNEKQREKYIKKLTEDID